MLKVLEGKRFESMGKGNLYLKSWNKRWQGPRIHGMTKILFICGKNRWRSPTAEKIYRSDPRVQVRSAGVSSGANHQLSQKDIEWCDLILVMEQKHKKYIHERFRSLELPPIFSLEIPDEYQFMDQELIELIKAGTEPHIITGSVDGNGLEL